MTDKELRALCSSIICAGIISRYEDTKLPPFKMVAGAAIELAEIILPPKEDDE